MGPAVRGGQKYRGVVRDTERPGTLAGEKFLNFLEAAETFEFPGYLTRFAIWLDEIVLSLGSAGG